jgi:predicted metal-dependent peptidase
MKQAVAMGKILMAIERLASNYPLHSGILAQWCVEEAAAIETMGIGFKDGKLRLVFSSSFVESISMDELVGVLHHEVNHVLFDHVLHTPAPGENRTARTIAEEVTVNEWVAEPLPHKPILLSDYPYLPENQDTDTRYGKLRKRIKPASCDSVPSANNTSAGKGGGVPRKASPDASSANGFPTVDNHGTWDEIVKNADQGKAAAQMDIATAWGNLTSEQKAKVTGPFASIAKDATQDIGLSEGLGLGIGKGAGEGTSMLDNGTAKVPWQVALRRYVGKVRECRPVFGRPPRRFPELVGIIPGKGRFVSKPKIMAVIDTSGSMTDAMLSDISAELGVMARHYKVVVVECDADIQAAYAYKPITKINGRGGTDFRPPFERDFLKQHKPDLVVYFTDGFGPAPDMPPAIPVVWCITEGGQKPAKWGKKIDLSDPKTVKP